MDETFLADVATGSQSNMIMGQPFNNDTISYPRPATIFASVCAVLFIVVGIIGNLVTAVALLRCPKLRGHATTAFVLSLCVSDLLFCTLSLPLTAVRYINEAWTLGDALCQLFPVLFYGNVAVSLLSMVGITVNRYILIARHNWYARVYSWRNICLQLLAVWAFSFAIMLPPLLGVWGRLGLDPSTFSCTILKKNGSSPKKFLFLVGFVVPCAVIIASYSCIYYKVRTSRRNLQAHSEANIKESGYSVREREDSRLTALMLTIFIGYLLCFLPLMLVNVADDDTKYPVLHVLASIMAWASSVVNPFIYAATNRQYRAAYGSLFNICKKQESLAPQHSNNNAQLSTSPPNSTPVSGKSQAPSSEVKASPPRLPNFIYNK